MCNLSIKGLIKWVQSSAFATHFSLLSFTTFANLLLDEPGAPLLIVQLMLLLPLQLFLAADGLRVTVNVLDVPSFGGLINFTEA